MSLELLKSWPTWAKANAETIFSSPAWRQRVSFAGEDAVLRRSEEVIDVQDMLLVTVTFDDEPHTLGLAKSAFYPDLNLLWEKRKELPQEVLLALVEKECGKLFQMLEDLARRQFAVKGLATDLPSEKLQGFELTLASGAKIYFAQTLSPLGILNFGQLDNLDTTHPTIREMTREAVVDYGLILLTDEEQQVLAAGDHLILPENFPAHATWHVGDFSADEVHIVGAEHGTLTFAQLADGDFPPVPNSTILLLQRGAFTLAAGELDKLGVANTLRLTSISKS